MSNITSGANTPYNLIKDSIFRDRLSSIIGYLNSPRANYHERIAVGNALMSKLIFWNTGLLQNSIRGGDITPPIDNKARSYTNMITNGALLDNTVAYTSSVREFITWLDGISTSQTNAYTYLKNALEIFHATVDTLTYFVKGYKNGSYTSLYANTLGFIKSPNLHTSGFISTSAGNLTYKLTNVNLSLNNIDGRAITATDSTGLVYVYYYSIDGLTPQPSNIVGDVYIPINVPSNGSIDVITALAEAINTQRIHTAFNRNNSLEITIDGRTIFDLNTASLTLGIYGNSDIIASDNTVIGTSATDLEFETIWNNQLVPHEHSIGNKIPYIKSISEIRKKYNPNNYFPKDNYSDYRLNEGLFILQFEKYDLFNNPSTSAPQAVPKYLLPVQYTL